MFSCKKTLHFSYLSIALLLIFLTFFTYLNILPNQLFYDDEELIYKNKYLADFKYFPRYFTENMIAGAGKLSNMYRPILLLSFAIDHLLWGNNPLGYHLTSIFLHAANSILVFLLVNCLFHNSLLAVVSAVFFIIHPVQTEAVAYASGRTDLLAFLFTLISLLLSLSFLYTSRYQLLKYISAIFFFILALLTKESAVIFPLLLLLVYKTGVDRIRKTVFKLTKIIIPIFLIDLVYIILRLTILNFYNILNFYQTNNIYSQHISVRLFTFAKVFFAYLGIFLFPKDLIFARDISYITSFQNVWVILFIFVVSGFLAFSIIAWRKNRLFLFSLVWFLTTLLPVSGIVPINNIIAEHYLYFPSVAVFLIFSCFIVFLWHRYKSLKFRTFFLLLLVFVSTVLVTRTMIRNLDWKSPLTFYSKSLAQSPWHIPMRHNLAMTYADQGEFARAIKEYELIISAGNVYPQTHHNLANAYQAVGKYSEAEKEYRIAIGMDPDFIFSYYSLADLYKRMNNIPKLNEIEEKLKTLQKL
ncbi:tetratricopeptide repeat protein [Candidatus Gottesmanbacteria bacterium]|nr:tetratricopeptide repeat protein [Candidatus Gottesmanbacteria bacterium]